MTAEIAPTRYGQLDKATHKHKVPGPSTVCSMDHGTRPSVKWLATCSATSPSPTGAVVAAAVCTSSASSHVHTALACVCSMLAHSVDQTRAPTDACTVIGARSGWPAAAPRTGVCHRGAPHQCRSARDPRGYGDIAPCVPNAVRYIDSSSPSPRCHSAPLRPKHANPTSSLSLSPAASHSSPSRSPPLLSSPPLSLSLSSELADAAAA